MSLEDLRRQYTLGGLHEADMPPAQMALFSEWLSLAIDHAPGEWVEPYAMTLATSTADGHVSARNVLLRAFDEAVGERKDGSIILDGEGPTSATIFIVTRRVAFGLLEVRQNFGVTPPTAAALRPGVVIGGIAAHVEHAVDRA